MSTTLSTKPLTHAQRAAAAAERVGRDLRLDNLKLLGAVLAEAAAEEAKRSSAFAERIRVLYAVEVKPTRTRQGAAQRTPKPPKQKREFTPIRHDARHEINFAARLDPYHLNYIFGEKQLPDLLDEFSATRLQEAVEEVQKRHPGTKPTRKAKAAIIDYIVRYVVDA